jgi:hypothetical protein
MKTHERNEAITSLREFLPRGTTVYTLLRHVGASGMTRHLDLYVVAHGEILRITWSIAAAIEGTYAKPREALLVKGCGFDVGHHVMERLSHALYGEGLALRHRWL